MSEGITLERLRVVVEGTTKPFQEEMRKLRAELRKENKEIDQVKNNINKSMEETLGPIRRIQEQIRKMISFKPVNMTGMSAQQKQLQRDITATERQLKKLIERRDELEDSGGDIEYTAEFKEMIKAAEQAERKLNSLIEKKEKLRATGGLRGASAKKLDYDIGQAENTLKYAKRDIDNTPASERFHNTEKWHSLNRQIERCRISLAQYHAKEQEIGRGTGRIGRISKAFMSMRESLKKSTTGIKKTSGAFAALIQKFKNGIPLLNRTKSSMNGLEGSGKGLGGMFRTIGMTAKFMFASFLIQGVLGQAKAGLQNLARYSNEYGTQFNKSVTMMYSALKQLQNALATAFAPIVNVVAPYIMTLVKHLTAGANALAQFFSALTGSKTWTKATYNTQNYADSVDSAAGSVKKLKNELYGFDEITKQQDDDTAGGSGGGGGLSPGDMFTEEVVNNQFADFAKMVVNAWKKADFTEIGEIVGNKLNAALNSIDWTKIQATTKKIAKSVATFLNGFIKATDWKLVGKTIANGINTAVLGAHTFLTTFDWGNLGKAVATTANSAIKNADFGLIGSTVAEGIRAAVKTWYNFVTTFDFSQLGSKIGTSINSFFSTMGKVDKDGMTGWQKMGKSFSKSIKGIAGAIITALDAVKWEEVGQAIADFIKTIDWKGITWNLIKMVKSFASALGDAIIGFAEENPVGAAIVVMIGIAKLSGLSGVLSNNITTYLSSHSLSLGKVAIGLGLGAATFKLADSDSTVERLVGAPITSFLSTYTFTGDVKLSLKIAAVTFAWDLGIDIGKAIGKAIFPEDAEYYDDFSWFGENGFFPSVTSSLKDGTFWEALKTMATDSKAWEVVKAAWAGKNFVIGTTLDATKETVTGWKKKIKEWWGNVKLAVYNKFETVRKAVKKWKDGVVEWWGDVKLSVKNKFDTVSGNVSEWFGKVKDWWGEKTLSIKNKFDTLSNNVANWYGNVKKWWGKKTLSIKNSFDTIASNVSDWYGNVKKWWGKKTLSIKNKFDTLSSDVSEWFGKIQNWWGKRTLTAGVTTSETGASLYEGVKGSWNTAAQTALSAKAVIDTVCNITRVVTGSTGASIGNTLSNISKYATGGLPPKGQLFVANEAGPEMVGTIDGKTAIANSNQIVSAVSSGVSSAVYGAIMAAMSASKGSGTDVNVYLVGDAEGIFKVVKETNNKKVLATGVPQLLS